MKCDTTNALNRGRIDIPGFQLRLIGGHQQSGRYHWGCSWLEGTYCIDLERLGVLWHARPNAPVNLARSVPREVLVQSGALWCNPSVDRVVSVFECDCGCFIDCRVASTGASCWTRHVALPAPLEWTEPAPAFPRAPTEHLDAFLAADTERLVLLMNRTSRRISNSTRNGLPPFRCQLDFIRLNPLTGDILYERAVPDVSVGILEREHFDGLFAGERCVGQIDWSTGDVDVIGETPKRGCWPIRFASSILTAWRDRGSVEIAQFSRQSGCIERSHRHKRARVRSLALRVCHRVPVLQINSQILSPLSDDLEPMWEAVTPPYVYSVMCKCREPMFVATAGNGGYLIALDADTGTQRLKERLEGGCFVLYESGDDRRLLGLYGRGFVVIEPPTLCLTNVRMAEGVDHLLAVRAGRLFVTTAEGSGVTWSTIPPRGT